MIHLHERHHDDATPPLSIRIPDAVCGVKASAKAVDVVAPVDEICPECWRDRHKHQTKWGPNVRIQPVLHR